MSDTHPTTLPVKPMPNLARQFDAFHRANPHIYRELREMSLKLRRAGWRSYGIATLVEQMRWSHDSGLATHDPHSIFKFNNSYRAFYARLLMQNEPELAGFFETRPQRWLTRRGYAHGD